MATETTRADSAAANQELSRIETCRLQYLSTVGSVAGPAPRDQWLPFGAGKSYPRRLPNSEEYVVEFARVDDEMNPQNWSTTKKYVFICYAVMVGG